MYCASVDSPQRRLRPCLLGLIVYCLATSSLPHPAMAQTATDERLGEGKPSDAKPRPTLRPADADGDGRITRLEWTKFVQGFRRFDADGDNAVAAAELTAAVRADAGDDDDDVRKLSPIVLAPVDFDGDDRATRAEWTSLAAAFKRVDADGDGVLVLAEFETVVAAKKEANEQTKSLALRAGLWRGAIVEGRGQNPNAGRRIELLIDGNRIAGRDVGRRADDANLGTGTFLASGKPNAGFLDAQYADGRVCRGIFEMRGDTLYWCVSNRGEQRPDEFVTANGFWLMVLKRVPDNK